MHGKKSATVWLEPETHPENILNELEDRLIGRSDNGNGDERFDEEIKIGFPEFDDLIKIGNEGFKPHLSLGQFRDEVSAKNAINNFSSKFSSDPIIEFDVTELYWIIRVSGMLGSCRPVPKGDKTIAFWLIDKEMYTNMSDLALLPPIIDHGMELHMIIRLLLTLGLGGKGYLNFEDNKFGHLDWLDFLVKKIIIHIIMQEYRDGKLLRYRYLNELDKAMQIWKKSWLVIRLLCLNEETYGFQFTSCKFIPDYKDGLENIQNYIELG
ncbi:20354_t:CDS:2 [Entrophospora sp. SA101]|nr:20354_t:CDS:2 [Entrophospora sp. SA101]